MSNKHPGTTLRDECDKVVKIFEEELLALNLGESLKSGNSCIENKLRNESIRDNKNGDWKTSILEYNNADKNFDKIKDDEEKKSDQELDHSDKDAELEKSCHQKEVHSIENAYKYPFKENVINNDLHPKNIEQVKEKLNDFKYIVEEIQNHQNGRNKYKEVAKIEANGDHEGSAFLADFIKAEKSEESVSNDDEQALSERYSSINEAKNSYTKENFKPQIRNSEEIKRPRDKTFNPPSEDLAEKIIGLCEFYFQDYNIFKHNYFLRRVQRNKDGYVHLKILFSFRDIRALTRDYRTISECLKKSKLLELNPEKNKVRRKNPVPKTEETSYGKTIMIFNVSNPTREYLKEVFGKFGKIVSAEIFDIDEPEIDVFNKRCWYYHQEISTKVFGVVEFEKYQDAISTFTDAESHLPKENRITVVPLMPDIFKKERKSLRFLRNYRPGTRQARWRNGLKNESRPEAPFSNRNIRRNNMNANDYYYQSQRRYYRRNYRGRKPFIPAGNKNYPEGQSGSEYNVSTQSMDNRRFKAKEGYAGNRWNSKPSNRKSEMLYAETAVSV